MAMFGWCLTGHHPNCPGRAGDLTCSCICHETGHHDN